MIMAKRENAFGKFLNYIEDKYKTTADDEAEDFGAKPKNLKQSRKRAKKSEDLPSDPINAKPKKTKKIE